jgi:hypothetical protein
MMTFGTALGPFAFGAIADISGSMQTAAYASLPVCFVLCVCACRSTGAPDQAGQYAPIGTTVGNAGDSDDSLPRPREGSDDSWSVDDGPANGVKAADLKEWEPDQDVDDLFKF